MKVKMESTRFINPIYDGFSAPTTKYIPLSVFDKVTYNMNMAIIYVFRPPTPPNETIEYGLQKALSLYREWAGRFGETEKGDSVIFLTDEGVKFTEASVDGKLDQVLSFEPSPSWSQLHPTLENMECLVQVQLTRFTCGSLVLGFMSHHVMADAKSACNFLLDWGKLCRGLDVNPLPFHDRTIFLPRNPPRYEFEHRGREFKSNKLFKHTHNTGYHSCEVDEDVIVYKFRFMVEFLDKLKDRAISYSLSNGASNNNDNKPFSRFESLVAHLWRTITKARGLAESETTYVRIAIDGRTRIREPQVPSEYIGNLVLWAFPTARVKELLQEPLPYATKIIHDAVVNVNNTYFKSFIDFATHKAVEEGLTPNADNIHHAICPNLEVYSWLHYPFDALDFGCGTPHAFMTSYMPQEGLIMLMPLSVGDGSIDAFVALSRDNMVTFKEACYNLQQGGTTR